MILIADSGSTKTDWRLVNGKNVSQFVSIGLNPDFVETEDVYQAVSDAFVQVDKKAVSEVFFYGSGCSSSERNKIVEKGLYQIFKDADVKV